MGIRKSIINYYTKGLKRFRKINLVFVELKNLKDRKSEWKDCKLSNDEMRKTQSFFKEHYGKQIPLYWHRMYKNYTGIFDYRYFPEILFSTKLEEVLNPYDVAFPLGNKAMNPQSVFPGTNVLGNGVIVTCPELICTCCHGVYWNNEGDVIGEEDAVKILKNYSRLIIKPTIESMGGRGVQLLDFSKLSDEEIMKEVKSYHGDFIVQKQVINHPSINKLYSSSINTFRVITFVTENDGIQVAPLSMRLGINGRIVDNGGIFIAVSEDGVLSDTGYSKKGIKRFSSHPDTGIEFAGYRVEGVPKLLYAAKKMHSKFPQLGMLSWDLAYNENGEVVVIEVNTTGQSVWFPQMISGKAIFGEYTAEMLHRIR